ncbi:MAG: hypothetical protein HON90_06475 [Halobacteriovoraceae bacterium]|jgi:microsomal dipeptidase-like Zn-dependent dipeptidase|nr:hypothetical protein [Halobacteriovoraceae bacterium]
MDTTGNKKLIDLHTHLDTLDDLFLIRSKSQNHLYKLEEHNIKGRKTILSVAIYTQFYQDHDKLIHIIKRLSARIDKLAGATLIKNKADLRSDFQLGVILHLESAHTFVNYEKELDQIFKLGVRGIIPVHFYNNKIGKSCDDLTPSFLKNKSQQGLTQFGIDFIKACNQRSIWLDVSHCTDQTTIDIIANADNVIASHIGMRELVSNKRNIPLSLIQKIIQKDGLIGLIPWQHLIGKQANAYQEQINYAIENNFVKNICIGSDFGSPIATHPKYRSIFDIERTIENNPDISDDMTWNNAYDFFSRCL